MTVWIKVKLQRIVKAKEIFESEVHDWGTGGAHIPFSSDYLYQKVIVIPIGKK